ncbi:exosome nuclease subunit, partial [Nowakowskiella sp. JEL0078]
MEVNSNSLSSIAEVNAVNESVLETAEISSNLFTSLALVSSSSAFLANNDILYLSLLDSTFKQRLENLKHKTLDIINHSLTWSKPLLQNSINIPQISDVDVLKLCSSSISDQVEKRLEYADNYLDEFSGKKIKSNLTGNLNSVVLKVNVPGKQPQNVYHVENIIRPQLKFLDKVDNSNNPPQRKITFKPHARIPLEYGLQGSNDISDEMSMHIKTLGITDASSSLYSLPHPYKFEIENLEYHPIMFEITPIQNSKPIEVTKAVWVDTPEKLNSMINDLSNMKEIAVDIEHHDYRSFQGFVCLLQISTRNQDYLIDALELRSNLHILNNVFADPKIVKVFHGADMDINWLQRDFGVYVVNMFDTYQASHGLQLSHHGLGFLLKLYCNVNADKQYQTADWRIRPLPTEMLLYAQMDTHYLLEIFDIMRTQLLKESNPVTHNILHSVLTKSRETSLITYTPELYDERTGEGPNGWRNALRKYTSHVTSEQLAVFKAIHLWRDQIARQEDESTRYVLPIYMLYSLVTKMPTNVNAILKCCQPLPPFVRMYAPELVKIIEDARAEARKNSVARAELKPVLQESKHTMFDNEGVELPPLPVIEKRSVSIILKQVFRSSLFNWGYQDDTKVEEEFIEELKFPGFEFLTRLEKSNEVADFVGDEKVEVVKEPTNKEREEKSVCETPKSVTIEKKLISSVENSQETIVDFNTSDVVKKKKRKKTNSNFTPSEQSPETGSDVKSDVEKTFKKQKKSLDLESFKVVDYVNEPKSEIAQVLESKKMKSNTREGKKLFNPYAETDGLKE